MTTSPYYTPKYETELLYVDSNNQRVLVRDTNTKAEEYLEYKSYRRQGSDSPVIFFTLPFSCPLDFVFTLTFWVIHLTLTLTLTLTYLSFHYLALIGFKPLLRRYDTVLSLDISSYHSSNFNEINFLPSVKSAFVTRMINLD